MTTRWYTLIPAVFIGVLTGLMLLYGCFLIVWYTLPAVPVCVRYDTHPVGVGTETCTKTSAEEEWVCTRKTPVRSHCVEWKAP
jgi:hypothetical protein